MPSRIISQKINVSNSLSKLSAFEEVVFLHLIVSCDDYGRFYGHPDIVKGMLFPRREFTSKQIESALSKLEDEGMIRRYECDGTTYLELTAWMKYQKPRAKESKYPGPNDDGSVLYAQEDDDICEQEREDTQSEVIKPHSEPKSAERFERFWNVYPKKVGKKEAEKAFEKIKVNDELLGKMVATIEKAKASTQWQKQNGQYIPNPATWLNQGRWEDELQPASAEAQSRGSYTPNHYVTDGSEGNPFIRR